MDHQAKRQTYLNHIDNLKSQLESAPNEDAANEIRASIDIEHRLLDRLDAKVRTNE